MKLLLIEDEPDLADSILRYLNGQAFLCEWAAGFEQARERLELHEYDCVLLDITLPDGNGLRLLEQLKKEGKAEGVIIISAINSLADRIAGLELGADDYLAKPFHLAELMARVQSVVRRRHFGGQPVIKYGKAEVAPISRLVTIQKHTVDLTRKEFDLLLFLLSNLGKVVSKEAMAEHLSGDEADLLDSFDFLYAQVKNLKKKMAEAGQALALRSIYGLGYKLELPDEAA